MISYIILGKLFNLSELISVSVKWDNYSCPFFVLIHVKHLQKDLWHGSGLVDISYFNIVF